MSFLKQEGRYYPAIAEIIVKKVISDQEGHQCSEQMNYNEINFLFDKNQKPVNVAAFTQALYDLK